MNLSVPFIGLLGRIAEEALLITGARERSLGQAGRSGCGRLPHPGSRLVPGRHWATIEGADAGKARARAALSGVAGGARGGCRRGAGRGGAAHDQAVSAAESRAQHKLAERLATRARASEDRLALTDEMLVVVCDPAIPDEQVGARLRGGIGMERLWAAREDQSRCKSRPPLSKSRPWEPSDRLVAQSRRGPKSLEAGPLGPVCQDLQGSTRYVSEAATQAAPDPSGGTSPVPGASRTPQVRLVPMMQSGPGRSDRGRLRTDGGCCSVRGRASGIRQYALPYLQPRDTRHRSD